MRLSRQYHLAKAETVTGKTTHVKGKHHKEKTENPEAKGTPSHKEANMKPLDQAFDKAVLLLQHATNIAILTGAGISADGLNRSRGREVAGP
jgi:hypothetical protein